MREIFIATARGLYSTGGRAPIAFEDDDVNALVPDASGSWAIVDGSRVFRASSGNWEQITKQSRFRLNCLLPGAEVMVGAAEARLYVVRDSDLQPLESFDQAEGRVDWFTPWGGPPDVRSIARGPSGAIYVNVHVGGILRSEDDGSSWVPTIDIRSDVHEVRAYEGDSAGGLVVAATARGLAVSHDGARTWAFADDGLHASYSRAVVVCNETILMSSSVGPHGGRSALYRRELRSAGGFSKCEGGLPEWFGDNIDSGCLAAEGSRVAFGTSDGRVFLSNDEGSSWAEAASGIPPVRAVVFT